MGPYSFAPFMQCNHGILSMDHGLQGSVHVGDEKISYAGGRGYVEKDWGSGFPRGYVWIQCNHFAASDVSVSASIATIPWLTGAFRGYLIGLLLDGRLFRFTTYTGARIEHIAVDDERVQFRVADDDYRLEISATRSDGGLLYAPYESRMIARVAEAMSSTVNIRLEQAGTGDLVFEDTGTCGCLEVQGDLQLVLEKE